MLPRCLRDTKPRAFDGASAAILSNFAELVMREVEMDAAMKRQLSISMSLSPSSLSR